MNNKHVAIGESNLNVVDQGSGPPILFVHGFPLDHTMWQFQIEEFAKRNRVICPDLPGFGESPAGNTPMSMKLFADQLAQLLDELEVNQPIVFCGLSMGGYIGWQFWRHHRDRLSHLVACDTRAANDSAEVARARRIAAQTVKKTGSQAVADTMVEKLFYHYDDPTKQSIVKPVHEVMARTDPNSIAGGQLAMAERPDATDWMPEIDLPTLFIVGEHDVITPPDEMRQNAELVSNSNFLSITNAGHMAPLEQPVEFNRGLAVFLDRD